MRSSGIRVAPPTATERSTVVDLLERQLAEHEIPISTKALVAAIDGVLEDQRRGIFLLAKHASEEAVGVAYVSFTWSLEHGGKSAWLEELYVLPEWRSRGIGGAMLAAVLDAARVRGCAAVDLEVESTHARAANLYARSGFTRHARTRWVRRLRG